MWLLLYTHAVELAGASTDPGTDFVNLLSKASGPTLMAIIIFGAINEWWVPGRSHRRCVQERDELLTLMLKQTDISHRTVAVAETRLTLSEQIAELSELVKREEPKRR